MSDAETEEDTTAALEEEEEEEEDEGLEGEGQDAEHEEEELEGQAGSRPLSSSSKLSATSLAPLTAPPQATPLPPPAITLDARGHAVLPPVGAGPAAAAALSPFSNGAGALLLRRGNTAFTARRLSEALALYRRGVKLCADSYEARLLLALLLNAGEACLQLAAQRAEDSLHAKPETGESPAAVAASSSSGQPAGPTAPGGPPRLLPLLGIRSAVRDGLAAEGAAFVQRALVKIDAGVTPAEAEACLLHVVPEARAWWTPLKAAFACPPSKTTKKKGKKKKKSAAKGKKTKGKKKKKK